LPADLLGDGASGAPADRSRRHGHGCGPGLGSRRPVGCSNAISRALHVGCPPLHRRRAAALHRDARRHQSRVIPPRGGPCQGLAAGACGSVTDSGAIESRAMAPCRVASAGEPRS
jgi:hypothetical protein